MKRSRCRYSLYDRQGILYRPVILDCTIYNIFLSMDIPLTFDQNCQDGSQ
jgi:hypothetical protein